jgi:hypothetical protein
MCGRFTLRTPAKDIAEVFQLLRDLGNSALLLCQAPIIATLIAEPADDDRPPAELGPVALLDGRVKGVHVDVQNGQSSIGHRILQLPHDLFSSLDRAVSFASSSKVSCPMGSETFITSGSAFQQQANAA